MQMKLKLTVAAAIAAVAGIAAAQDTVVKIGHVAPMSGAAGPLRQGQRERRAHGHRGPERAGRHHRRQEDQVRDPGRRRRRRSEAGHGCRPEAVRRQGRRRGRPPELGHHHPRLQGLQRLRHSPRHRRGHQPQPDQARLQDHLPHHRQRQRAGRGPGAVCGRHAQAQEGRHHRRPHGLRPGRCRSVQEDGGVQGHAGRGRSSSRPTRPPTSWRS